MPSKERRPGSVDSLERSMLEDPIATVRTNVDGIVRTWNPAAERLFGFPAAEVVGQRAPTVPRSESRAARNLGRRSAHGATTAGLEIRRRRKDGKIVDLLVFESPLRDEAGAMYGTLAHYIDISDHTRMESDLREAVENLERRGREMTLLAELGELLAACQTFEEAHPAIGGIVGSLFPVDAGALFSVQPAHRVAEAITIWGEPPPSQRVMSLDDCLALRRGRLHVVAPDEELLCPHIAEPLTAGALCEPLAAGGETMGLLHLQIREPPRPNLLSERQRLTQALGEQLSLALANFRLRKELREQSARDPLTDLYNRRFMEEFLYRELRRADRDGDGVGILMIDIDRFKALNDAFGHPAGDATLRTISDYLRSEVRDGDIVCRCGGEEFVVVMPKASLADSEGRAETLRQGVKMLGSSSPGALYPSVTISVGVAALPDHGRTSEELLAAADRALYRAKAAGRDRVEVADEGDGHAIEIAQA